jgi:hypothetical protein
MMTNVKRKAKRSEARGRRTRRSIHTHAQCIKHRFRRYAQRIQRRSVCTHEMIFMVEQQGFRKRKLYFEYGN